MELWLNIGFAWISMILVVMLSVIYLFRFVIKRDFLKRIVIPANRVLRKHHKLLGIALILTGLIHGLFSSDKVWSINIGTVSWIMSILLGMNWMFRKHYNKPKLCMVHHRILTLLFIGTIFWHILDVGGIQVFNLLGGSNVQSGIMVNVDPSLVETTTGLELKDGVYEGEAVGYRPGIKVSVTIKDNKMVSITVIEHQEVNASYYQKAIEIVPGEIIKEQDTDVDAITGATFTSIGIMNAVNDALSKALVSGELLEDKTLPLDSKRDGRGQGRGGHSGSGGR